MSVPAKARASLAAQGNANWRNAQRPMLAVANGANRAFGTASAFYAAMSAKPLARQVVPGPAGAESASAAEGSIRPRDSLFHWCGTVDAMAQTTNADEQRALLEVYFAAVAESTVAPASRFFAGDLFYGAKTRIAWAVMARAIQDLTRVNVNRRRGRRIVQGDLSNAVAEGFAGRLPSGLSVSEVDAWASELARAEDEDAQLALLRDMLARLSAIEAKYLVSLIAGEFRLGVSRQQIEEAASEARSARR